MAKKLGPDGVPVDIPSTPRPEDAPRLANREADKAGGPGSASSGDDPTASPSRSQRSPLFPEEPPTKPVTRSAGGGARGATQESGGPRTVIAGGRRRAAGKGAEGGDEPGMADSVVGWLVVVDGPGKGSSVRLGNGQNGIGRGQNCRVRLNFGDQQISRNDHAVLTYDPRGNRFYIRQGQGVNLVYLDENPVLETTPLRPGSRIALGETTLRFIAFCDDEFTWLDQEEPGE